MDLKLDSAGIVAVLNSGEVAAAVAGLAEGIASQVRGQVDAIDGVVVDRYTTDLAAASVTIKDPRAKLWEARDGVLTRAAAGQGLEVTAR
jgi:hypothetical protein